MFLKIKLTVKNTLILGGFIVLIIIFLTVVSLVKQSNDTTSKQTVIPQMVVATDPNFPEVKGQLISGFPQMPVYPEAMLEASAKTNPEGQIDTGYRAKWTTQGNVPTVMKWYKNELPKGGWQFKAPSDMNNTGEQVAKISNDNYTGNISVEAGFGNKSEIIIEVRKN